MTVPLGDPRTAVFETFSDAAKTTHADPTAATIYVKAPDGTITPHTWPSGDLTHVSTGKFSWTLPNTASGAYQWRGAATGAVATGTRAGFISVDDAFPAALVSLEDAKAALNMTGSGNDDELQTLIYSASSVLLNHPDYRVADVASVSTHTEWVDAGTDLVMLQHYPATVTSVTEYDGSTTQALAAEPIAGGTFTSYGWDYADGTGANGMLIRLSGGYPILWGGRRVKVVYTAGAGSVPADVRDAALKLVKHLWRDQRGYDNEPANPFNPEAPAFTSTAHLIPWEVEEALRAYKRAPVVA